jgi:hypothetical protein
MNEFSVSALDIVPNMPYQSDKPADSVPRIGDAIPIDSASNVAFAPIVPTRETAAGGLALPVGWC